VKSNFIIPYGALTLLALAKAGTVKLNCPLGWNIVIPQSYFIYTADATVGTRTFIVRIYDAADGGGNMIYNVFNGDITASQAITLQQGSVPTLGATFSGENDRRGGFLYVPESGSLAVSVTNGVAGDAWIGKVLYWRFPVDYMRQT